MSNKPGTIRVNPHHVGSKGEEFTTIYIERPGGRHFAVSVNDRIAIYTKDINPLTAEPFDIVWEPK